MRRASCPRRGRVGVDNGSRPVHSIGLARLRGRKAGARQDSWMTQWWPPGQPQVVAMGLATSQERLLTADLGARSVALARKGPRNSGALGQGSPGPGPGRTVVQLAQLLSRRAWRRRSWTDGRPVRRTEWPASTRWVAQGTKGVGLAGAGQSCNQGPKHSRETPSPIPSTR